MHRFGKEPTGRKKHFIIKENHIKYGLAYDLKLETFTITHIKLDKCKLFSQKNNIELHLTLYTKLRSLVDGLSSAAIFSYVLLRFSL